MELVAGEVDGGELLVGDDELLWVVALVEAGVDREAGAGGGGGDQVDDVEDPWDRLTGTRAQLGVAVGATEPSPLGRGTVAFTAGAGCAGPSACSLEGGAPMRVWQEEPSVVMEEARERVVGGSAPLITLRLGAEQMPSGVCCLRASEARRLAGELLAAAAAAEELS